MKAKTTPVFFSKKDFAISIVNAAASKYLLFAILLAVFSFNGYAQPYPLHNGRTIIESHHGYTAGSLSFNNLSGYNPFSSQSNGSLSNKSSRTQMIYTADEFTDSGAMSGKITRISFRVLKMFSYNAFKCSDFTVRFAQTNLSSFQNNNDRFIPQAMALTVGRSGPLTISGSEFVPDPAGGGWITIVLTNPYSYNLNLGQNLIVDISKTLATTGNNWTIPLNQSVYVANYSGPGFYGVRGCYGTGTGTLPDGKVMFTGPNPGDNSTNTIMDQGTGENRKARPYIKFTYEASAANSQSFQYPGVPLTPICYGDPVVIGVENMYATGYVSFQWKWSSAPLSGYNNIPGETGLTYATTQGTEKMYYRLAAFYPDGSETGVTSFNGDSYAIMPAIKTYEAAGWVDNAVPVAGESAYFKANPSWSPMQILDLCSIKVAAGVTMTVPEGNTLKLDRPILEDDIEGQIIFENNSALLQTTNAANEALNISYKRITQPLLRYDYTYYSSPIENMNLFAVSPQTLTDKFWSYSNNDWVMENASTLMMPGKGYIIRAPQTFNISGTKQIFTAAFTGKPNNGPISTAVSPVQEHYNLVGNPYPSAVNVLPFVVANDFLDGNVYLWDHITAPSIIYPGSGTYNYNDADYFAANVLGTPNGPTDFFVAAGQSFMIKTKTAGTSSAVWTNAMRVGNTDVLFHKIENNNLETHHTSIDANTQVAVTTESAGRFWLELQANNGAVRRVLVGFIEGATDDNDRLFDAEPIEVGATALYTIGANAVPLSIMGKGLPFNDEQIIPLGFKTDSPGNHTISKFLQDGFMENYVVYLNDKLTNTVHNLSDGSYTFSSVAGTFNDRFVIAFKTKNITLLNDALKPNRVVVFDKHEAVQLHSGDVNINNVIIYDLSGRVLARVENCKSTAVALSTLPRKNQLLVVEVHLENGAVEIQKFRF